MVLDENINNEEKVLKDGWRDLYTNNNIFNDEENLNKVEKLLTSISTKSKEDKTNYILLLTNNKRKILNFMDKTIELSNNKRGNTQIFKNQINIKKYSFDNLKKKLSTKTFISDVEIENQRIVKVEYDIETKRVYFTDEEKTLFADDYELNEVVDLTLNKLKDIDFCDLDSETADENGENIKDDILFVPLFKNLDKNSESNIDVDEFINKTKDIGKTIIVALHDGLNDDRKFEECEKFYFYTYEKDVKGENNDSEPTKGSENRLKKLAEEINNESKCANVLLLAMSTFKNPDRRQVNRYSFSEDGEEISGYYYTQMEPVPKMLIQKLATKKEKLDKIFVLNTEETVNIDKAKVDPDEFCIKINDTKCTPFSYFKDLFNTILKKEEGDNNDDNVVDIPMFTKTETNLEKALYNFYKGITDLIINNKNCEKVNLYVDIHGGLRDSFAVVDAILMLLKDMENIELKNIYTVEYDEGESKIRDCKDRIVNIFDFVNGMNEFLNYGRSAGLVEFDNNNGKKNTDLVNAINSISDGILLNRTNLFEDSLGKLNSVLNPSPNSNNNNNNSHGSTQQSDFGYFDIVADMIKSDYKIIINNNNFDLLDSENGMNNLVVQLQWCLNKKHYQQALILIENRTALYLKDKGLFDPSQNGSMYHLYHYYDKKKNKVFKKNNPPTKKEEENEINIIWGNWAKYSLCCPNDLDNNDENYFYFKSWDENNYFNGIKILGKINKQTILDIDNSIINKNYNNKYLNSDYKDKPQIKRKRNPIKLVKLNKTVTDPKGKPLTYKYLPYNSPMIDKNTKNDTNLMKQFYILLYVYKGLKKYRNSVAHPDEDSQSNNQTNNANDLSIEEVHAWIQFYINLLQKVVNRELF